MNPIPMVRQGSDEVLGYVCEQCKIFHNPNVYATYSIDAAKSSAERCCVPRVCETHGSIERNSYCRGCADEKQAAKLQAAYDKAKKIPSYEWTDPVVDPDGQAGDDGWCLSVEDLLDQCDEPLAWVWGTVKLDFPSLDAEDIVSNTLREWHEDAIENADVAGLQKLLDAWVAAQKECVCWMEDHGVVVVIQPESEPETGADK